MNTEQIKGVASRLYPQLQKLFDLIENLLTWANLQMDGIAKDPVLVNVSNVVVGSYVTLESSFQKKEITFKNQIDTESTVFADRTMFLVIMRNLISNAMKFTEKGGDVLVTGRVKGDFYEVKVQDSGVGFDVETVQNLFKITEVISRMGTDGERGTGLGLILVKEFVELNDGGIQVKSSAGQGTTVAFTLPLHQ
ncbi:MAG: two-component system sensor histidine kinase/response regulator [bacterium]|jgi:two-component system sensor histidine kinase/response regulator